MKNQPKKCRANGMFEREEYVVQDFMYPMHRMAQICGIAPVIFRKHPDGWRMLITPTCRLIQYTVFTVMNACFLAGLIIDITAGFDQASRAHTPTRLLVWVSEFLTVVGASSVVVFGNLKRTVKTMECLMKIQKINSKIGRQPPKHSPRWLYAVLFLPLLVFSLIILPEYSIFIEMTIAKQRNLTSACLYFFYNVTYHVMNYFRIHVFLCIMEACKTLRSLNDQLENIEDIELQSISKKTVLNATTSPDDIQYLTKHGFGIINTIRKEQEIATRPSKLTPATVRHFIAMYDAIYQTIRLLDENYSFELLMLLIISLQQLTMTPYNFLVNLWSGSKCSLPLLVFQFCWIILHSCAFIALVEPCHRTKQEVDRASYLVGQLITKVHNELVYAELDRLSRYLSLKVSYSPMGVCTISRSLIASYTGSVATYLVIMVQFQGYDKGEF